MPGGTIAFRWTRWPVGMVNLPARGNHLAQQFFRGIKKNFTKKWQKGPKLQKLLHIGLFAPE